MSYQWSLLKLIMGFADPRKRGIFYTVASRSVLLGISVSALLPTLSCDGSTVAEAGPDRIPERRLLYRTDSWLIRGRAEVHYRYGPLSSLAVSLPYDSADDEAGRRYRSAAEREMLALSGLVEVAMVPDYYMHAYLDPETMHPLRAVRWKNDFPDVLFDFLAPDRLLITRAEPVSAGFLGRIGSLLRRSSRTDQPEFESAGHYGPMPVGTELVDLMTVLYRLEEKFTANPHPPTEPFYLAAVRKDPSNIYLGRFEPVEKRAISLRVNGVRIRRPAVRCEVTLKYGIVVRPDETDTIESLAAEYLPDQPRAEAAAMIRTIIGGDNPEDWKGKTFILPVSMSVYNRIHDDDKDFRGPFGLSESVTLWIDEKLGIPLRAECRIYGIGGAVLLTECDDDFFRLLQP